LVGLYELYDVQDDPGETKNLIEIYPDVKEEMIKAYEEWWSEARPLMVNEFVPMSPVRPFHEMYKKQIANEGIQPWIKPDFQ
jgi:hypothetical protein